MATVKIVAKSHQQRYLEAVVRVEKCACGCGDDVEVYRHQTFPSYLKRRRRPGFFTRGHNVKFDREARLAASTWPSGERARAYKGGRRVRVDGYVDVLTPGGYKLEHRVVMSEAIGREVLRDEAVHHLNGVRSDNRIENLKIMSLAEHAALHSLKRSRDAGGRFEGAHGSH